MQICALLSKLKYKYCTVQRNSRATAPARAARACAAGRKASVSSSMYKVTRQLEDAVVSVLSSSLFVPPLSAWRYSSVRSRQFLEVMSRDRFPVAIQFLSFPLFFSPMRTWNARIGQEFLLPVQMNCENCGCND